MAVQQWTKIRQKDGTFGSVSLGRHTHVSTAPAMNEGNIEKVLTSPHTDDKTKQLVVVYLITRNQVNPPSANVTSVNSGSATGTIDSIPKVTPTKTGVDHIVDKAAETMQEVIPPTVDSVSKATANVTESVANATANSVNSISTASTQWTRRFKIYYCVYNCRYFNFINYNRNYYSSN